MKTRYNRLVAWLCAAADHPFVVPLLVFVSVIDFFILIIPAEVFFVAALVGNPRKYIRFSAAMIVGRLAGIAAIYFGVVQMPLARLHEHALELGLESVWNRCQVFFDLFGGLSLGVTAITPFPMIFVTAMSAVAQVELWKLEVYALGGLVIRYAILSFLVISGRRYLVAGGKPLSSRNRDASSEARKN